MRVSLTQAEISRQSLLDASGGLLLPKSLLDTCGGLLLPKSLLDASGSLLLPKSLLDAIRGLLLPRVFLMQAEVYSYLRVSLTQASRQGMSAMVSWSTLPSKFCRVSSTSATRVSSTSGFLTRWQVRAPRACEDVSQPASRNTMPYSTPFRRSCSFYSQYISFYSKLETPEFPEDSLKFSNLDPGQHLDR